MDVCLVSTRIVLDSDLFLIGIRYQIHDSGDCVSRDSVPVSECLGKTTRALQLSPDRNECSRQFPAKLFLILLRPGSLPYPTAYGHRR